MAKELDTTFEKVKFTVAANYGERSRSGEIVLFYDGAAKVTFTGILTEYQGAAQFTLIDLSGVKKADGSPWYDSNNKEIK